MKTVTTAAALMICLFFSACSQQESSALFTVGGVMSGLTGTVVLQNNGADTLTVKSNGPFVFPTLLASGKGYKVTVKTNPAGQSCLVTNGTGTITLFSIADVSVLCSDRGGLDSTFNSPNGFVVHNNAAGGDGDDAAYAVALDSRGRIVTAGTSTNSAGDTDMAIWWFNPDGTLDTAGTGSGFLVHGNAAGGNGDDAGRDLVIDSQDRVLVTGSSTTTGGATDMVVWRISPDGTLDTSFNGAGFVLHDGAATGAGDEAGRALTLDGQGRILVTGFTTTNGTMDMAVWRFNANGTIDTSFNKSGFFTHNNAAGGSGDDAGNAIAVDSQGRILVAGSSTNLTGETNTVVWRLKADGTLDTTAFGSPRGYVVDRGAAGGTGSDSANAVVVDPQGRIVAVGSSENMYGDKDMVLWRFKTDGTLDSALTGSGIVVNNGAAGGNGDDVGRSVIIDPQGNIIVTGSSTNFNGSADMVVWRFKSDGTLDTNFNTSGIVVNNGAAGGNGDDSGNGVALDSDNRIIVTGTSQNSAGNSDMAVWRLFE